jgi:hypothetical protein
MCAWSWEGWIADRLLKGRTLRKQALVSSGCTSRIQPDNHGLSIASAPASKFQNAATRGRISMKDCRNLLVPPGPDATYVSAVCLAHEI